MGWDGDGVGKGAVWCEWCRDGMRWCGDGMGMGWGWDGWGVEGDLLHLLHLHLDYNYTCVQGGSAPLLLTRNPSLLIPIPTPP